MQESRVLRRFELSARHHLLVKAISWATEVGLSWVRCHWKANFKGFNSSFYTEVRFQAEDGQNSLRSDARGSVEIPRPRIVHRDRGGRRDELFLSVAIAQARRCRRGRGSVKFSRGQDFTVSILFPFLSFASYLIYLVELVPWAI